MQVSAVSSPSPRFNGYSSGSLSEIAARVVEELRDDVDFSADFYNEFCFGKWEKSTEAGGSDCEADGFKSEEMDGSEEVEGVEFAFVSGDSENFPPVSADQIFQDGVIRPFYPIQDSNLLLRDRKNESINDARLNSNAFKASTFGPPLRKLFIEEIRETATTMSCSSSEADELDGIPANTYCVWRPKVAEDRQWRKSCSVGSNSKRWKFLDILQRSHSLGSKDAFVISYSNNSGSKKEEITHESRACHVGRSKDNLVFSIPNNNRRKTEGEKIKEPPAVPAKLIPPPYKRSDGEKRRSYLPYRQDLVGFLANGRHRRE